MSTGRREDTSFGNPSLIEKVGYFISFALHMPLVLVWALLTSPIHSKHRHKTWNRWFYNKTSHHLTGWLNVKQLQWITGTTRDVYEAWAKKNGLPVIIDELGEGGQLLWIGERRTDRVILYFHGGAYTFGVQPPALPFWKYIKTELMAKNKDVGLALLAYSLVPTAPFPTQLKQATLALQHLISTGVDPQTIQLAGDSAGANLVLSLISHLLHPLSEDVPHITLSSPLRGIYLMSPWVMLSSVPEDMANPDESDVTTLKHLACWGRTVITGIPESQRPYLEPANAPDTWFTNIDTVVDRVLITAGEAECLRNVIVACVQKISQHVHHHRVQFVVQKGGAVHNDPFLDFLTMDKLEEEKVPVVGELTPLIVEWFVEGF